MFTQVLSPINENENHTPNNPSQNQQSIPSRIYQNLFTQKTILTLLTISTTLLFIQTQSLTLRISSQQHQIDSLRNELSSTSQHMEHAVEQQRDLTVIHMAGTFTLLTCLMTTFHMTHHLRNMNQPFVQRKVLAILWMSPIYGLTSFLCLVLPSSVEGYLTIVKDFYESYVIYTFLSFLIAVLGRGDRERVIRTLRRSSHLDKPYRWLRCLFHPAPEESEEALARAVLMECQVLGMQFVFLNSFVAILEFVLDIMSQGRSDDGAGADSGFAFSYSPKFVLLMVRNVSVFLAFSGLLKFYHAVRDELAWCQPFNKFLTIKGVVFMTFWQGLAINIFFQISSSTSAYDNTTDSDEENNDESTISANGIQHILICMEMLFFSIAHWCVFPSEEWEEGYKVKYYDGPGFGFKDFASDVSLIIDDGKKSIRARRGMKKGAAALGDDSASMSTGRESPSFGSVDELGSERGSELDGTDDAQPLV